MTVDTQPWLVPNYIILEMPTRSRQDGIREAPKLHVKDVNADTLAGMCDEFRAEVFRKAGKADPALEGR